MNKSTFFLMIFSVFIFGCQAQNTRNYTYDNSGGDKLASPIYCPENIEILEYSFVADTLIIVSVSDFLYYPFGYFQNKKDLLGFTNTIGQDSIQSGKYEDGPRFHRFSHENSYLRFLEGETGRLEIVGAKITDAEIALRNQIVIGLEFGEVLRRITDSIHQEDFKNVKVIELISGLQGVWQYYEFKAGILAAIYIDTDYIFDKN